MSDANGQHELPIDEPMSKHPPERDPRDALLKQNRRLEETFLRRIDELRGHGAHDPRWLAQAKTKMEEAFMCLTRAIENPSRITGELDD